ncbi:hypothetical protein BKA70DRAFT_1430522 [Coprinopsis sp. MPI-PUGE-AT-0042]|nr:hypothetical protein BKA70DRAFT_1430522 [Coprinopsis sp. MPI-PUGE-AT-0042]
MSSFWPGGDGISSLSTSPRSLRLPTVSRQLLVGFTSLSPSRMLLRFQRQQQPSTTVRTNRSSPPLARFSRPPTSTARLAPSPSSSPSLSRHIRPHHLVGVSMQRRHSWNVVLGFSSFIAPRALLCAHPSSRSFRPCHLIDFTWWRWNFIPLRLFLVSFVDPQPTSLLVGFTSPAPPPTLVLLDHQLLRSLRPPGTLCPPLSLVPRCLCTPKSSTTPPPSSLPPPSVHSPIHPSNDDNPGVSSLDSPRSLLQRRLFASCDDDDPRLSSLRIGGDGISSLSTTSSPFCASRDTTLPLSLFHRWLRPPTTSTTPPPSSSSPQPIHPTATTMTTINDDNPGLSSLGSLRPPPPLSRRLPLVEH